MFNVGPYEPDFCWDPSITSCEQCAQWTEAVGWLDFGVFLDDPFWFFDGEIQQIVLDLHLPPSWVLSTLSDFEICGGPGNFTLVQTGDATFRCTVDYDMPRFVGDFAPIGRFFIGVDSYGSLDVSAVIDGEPDIWVTPAEAGVQCTYHFRWCDEAEQYNEACNYALEPQILELAAVQGGTDSGVVLADPNMICPVEFTADAEWLTLELHQNDPPNVDVTVTANAGSLPVGVHETWLRAEAESRSCTRVIFRVEASTPVRPMSWGKTKAIFR